MKAANATPFDETLYYRVTVKETVVSDCITILKAKWRMTPDVEECAFTITKLDADTLL